MSIWDCEIPLDAMMLSHDHIAMLAVKHEQQIKDIAAHLLELKQRVTPMMEFKQEKLKNEPPKHTWVGLTGEEIGWLTSEFIKSIEAKLKEKNGG